MKSRQQSGCGSAAVTRAFAFSCALITAVALVALILLSREHTGLILKRLSHSGYQPAESAAESALLAHVFAGIVFNWNVEKLVHLKAAVLAILQWQTRVHLCVITNQPDALQHVLSRWALPQVHVCRYTEALEDEKYALLWKHREIFGEAVRSGKFTSFVYTEDDQEITWPAMQSWARDAAALEPLGFQRAFMRTELDHVTGEAIALDVIHQVNVTDWPRVVHLTVPGDRACRLVNASETWWAMTEQPAGCVHQHYLALKDTYAGVWAATSAKLAAFMASPHWNKAAAEAARKGDDLGDGMTFWSSPERSAAMLQLLDVPEGFFSAAVVPYDPVLKVIPPIVEVQHLRNGYVGKKLTWAVHRMRDLLL